MFHTAINHSLADSSRGTYGTGQRALMQFSSQTGITYEKMKNCSPASVNTMFQTFSIYLRDTRGIQSTTIGQYLSHCATTLREQQWQGADHIHSPILAKLLSGWHREDIHRNPARLKASIPATAAVMTVFFKIAAHYFRHDPRKSAEIQACAATTYYMALRAAEGAAATASNRDSPLSPDGHHLRTNEAFFRFPEDDRMYPACAGTVFPPGALPITFDVLQDSSKTYLQRGAAHCSAHRNPSVTGKSFDVVLLVWNYVTNFPPTPGGTFFPTILASDLTYIMKQTAMDPTVLLDPNRLTARCMRTGSATMIKNMSNKLLQQQDLEMIRDHGRWISDVGNRIYAHQNPDAQRMVIAPSLYDDGYMTPNYLRWFYMTPTSR